MTSTSAYANASGHGLGAQALAYALQLTRLNIPYQLGGESLASMDCSGLVQFVYSKLGVNLPRTSQAQAGAGTPVAYSAAQPGDLLIYSEPGEGPNSHVGIYAGNGQQVEAAHPGTNVRLSAVDLSHLTKVVRPLGVGTQTATDANWLTNLLQGIGGAAGDGFVPGSGSAGSGLDPLAGGLGLGSLGTSIAGTAITGLLALGAVALVGVGLYRGTQNPSEGTS
jgi:hypothetical protein